MFNRDSLGREMMEHDSERHRLSKEELIQRASVITGGDVAGLSPLQLVQLMTVTQFVTDLCLNEVERRGGLKFEDGAAIVPYVSDYMVQTVLTR